MARLINGRTLATIKPRDGRRFTAQELRGHLGGPIMVLPVPSARISAYLVVLDHADGQPLNEVAGECIGMPVAGPAIICVGNEVSPIEWTDREVARI